MDPMTALAWLVWAMIILSLGWWILTNIFNVNIEFYNNKNDENLIEICLERSSFDKKQEQSIFRVTTLDAFLIVVLIALWRVI